MRYRPPDPSTIVLERHAGRLEVRAPGERPGCGVRAEWPTRVAGRPSAKSPLCRALGGAEHVMDATGGFGVDAWTIATGGATVTIVERSPIMAALLADALEHAQREVPGIASRITLVQEDAIHLLARTATGSFDAIYLDPMFPPKRRASALPSKQMQFLAAILGEDGDAAELLAAARRVAGRRVVVKRPPHAPPLGPGVTHSIASKLLRFDVFAPVRSPAPPGAKPGAEVEPDGGRR